MDFPIPFEFDDLLHHKNPDATVPQPRQEKLDLKKLVLELEEHEIFTLYGALMRSHHNPYFFFKEWNRTDQDDDRSRSEPNFYYRMAAYSDLVALRILTIISKKNIYQPKPAKDQKEAGQQYLDWLLKKFLGELFAIGCFKSQMGIITLIQKIFEDILKAMDLPLAEWNVQLDRTWLNNYYIENDRFSMDRFKLVDYYPDQEFTDKAKKQIPNLASLLGLMHLSDVNSTYDQSDDSDDSSYVYEEDSEDEEGRTSPFNPSCIELAASSMSSCTWNAKLIDPTKSINFDPKEVLFETDILYHKVDPKIIDFSTPFPGAKSFGLGASAACDYCDCGSLTCPGCFQKCCNCGSNKCTYFCNKEISFCFDNVYAHESKYHDKVASLPLHKDEGKKSAKKRNSSRTTSTTSNEDANVGRYIPPVSAADQENKKKSLISGLDTLSDDFRASSKIQVNN